MAETTIEWTSGRRADGSVVPGFTFNPWEGCEKISPACANCYAAERDRRFHGGNHWGPNSSRLFHGDSYWKQPMKWNKDAATAGERRKVFCASLADVFEDRPELTPWRADLFSMIAQTPNLDWLLLTKRPENINRMVADYAGDCAWLSWHGTTPRTNIWIGTSVENQEQADKRIPELLNVEAPVRFLSMERLLGPVDLSGRTIEGVWIDEEYADADPELRGIVDREGWPIHWVIVGGESGSLARYMKPEWALSIRDQCLTAGIAFHFKQWGGVNKKLNGRLLDGRTWDQFPQVER